MFYSVYSSSENLCFSSGPAVSGVVVHSPSLDPDNWLTMTYEEFADKNWEDRLEYEMKMAMECEKNTELEELYRVESQEDTPSGNIDDDSESSVSSLLSPYDAAVSILMDGRFGVLEWSTVDGGSLPKFKEDVELEGDSEEDDMKDRDEYLANVDSGLSDTEVSMHPLYDPDSSVMVDCDCELELQLDLSLYLSLEAGDASYLADDEDEDGDDRDEHAEEDEDEGEEQEQLLEWMRMLTLDDVAHRLFVMADDVPRDPVVEGWSVGAVAEVEECEEDEDEDRAIEDGWVYLMLDDLIEA
ncbi:hypothetical protein OE88DRAFT_1663668 [Heliocybe sulcata]|uniref:Uncharacterized protein n=1 Tax=Heliocybe sulcata TaxID=5364 RepID=A0A5C3MU54_9AGAM|nr:hypothetical protein OE88DRAFT_1663668 [Heliocybe sulcata]